MVTFRASQISEKMFCIVYYNDHWLRILFYNSSYGGGFFVVIKQTLYRGFRGEYKDSASTFLYSKTVTN